MLNVAFMWAHAGTCLADIARAFASPPAFFCVEQLTPYADVIS